MTAPPRCATALPQIPPLVRTREGVTFDPRQDVWDVKALHNRMVCRFDDIPGAHPALAQEFKATLARFARTHSLSYVDGLHWRFRTLMTFIASNGESNVREISSAHLINFRASCLSHEYVLGGLRAFLRRWALLGLRGVSEEAVGFMKAARLRPNPRGVAVATMDPRVGPLTDLELQATLEALTGAFAKSIVSLSEYLLAMFFILLAPRPIQLAALKCVDFRTVHQDGASPRYVLQIPRAKQRLKPRTEFRLRPLPAPVGELVALQVREATAAWTAAGGTPESAPLFPAPTGSSRSVCSPGLRGHCLAADLGHHIQRVLSKLAPTSERTGERIVLNALRFRRTLATRTLAAGYGLRVAADLLDHSDLQSVQVYAGLRPGLYERIHKATVLEIAPLVDAFQGHPISVLDKKLRRITDPHADRSLRRPVGCCGTARTCGFAAPVACYTCESFRPWLDGPHEAALDRLIKEQERVRTTSGDAMAATLGRTIYAVAQVVRACRAHREKEV